MENTSYSFAKVVDLNFDQALQRVTEELQKEGFGILTEIDVKATLKKKLDVDFRPYKILGACSPPHAYQVLQAEEQIGLMLPCNVIVFENKEGKIVVAAINPTTAMASVQNEKLAPVAETITSKLKAVIDRL